MRLDQQNGRTRTGYPKEEQEQVMEKNDTQVKADVGWKWNTHIWAQACSRSTIKETELLENRKRKTRVNARKLSIIQAHMKGMQEIGTSCESIRMELKERDDELHGNARW